MVMSNKLETLSILMDEKEKEISPILHNLFSFQELVENKLVPSIEKVQYERKYKLIDNMRDITAEISFYLQAPYLIGKKVYGIYHINDNRVTELINSLLGDEFKQKNAKHFFCSDVPTIIYPEKENDMISALNIADTSILMGKSDYYEVVNLEKDEGMELGSLLRFISVPSSIMDSNTAYILIPEKMNKENKYYQAICDSIDYLREFDYIQAKDVAEYDRIVVGSYSCFNYFQFLTARDIDLSKREFDIVIPTIPQMQLNKCCNEKILNLIEKAHSVVVNDYGMLSLMYDRVDKKKIRLGRCFIKDYKNVSEERESDNKVA